MTLIFFAIISLSVGSMQLPQINAISNSSNTFLEYTNSTYGFKIQYPENWKVIEDPSNNGAMFAAPSAYPGNESITHVPLVGAGIQKSITSASLDEYVDNFIEWFKTRNQNVDVTERNEIIISNQPGVRFDISFMRMGLESESTYYMILKERDIYFVFSLDVLQKYPDQLPLVKHVMDSFRLIDNTLNNTGQVQNLYNIEKSTIPTWIKNNAKWWSEEQIGDRSFLEGIQFLIKEGIMEIPPTVQGDPMNSSEIPTWIKNNAGWWADGSIDDASFVQGIQFLVKEGIMRIESE